LSLIDLSLNLALNLSEQGLGLVAASHGPGDQHIPVRSKHYSEYRQALPRGIVDRSGNTRHDSHLVTSEDQIVARRPNVRNGSKADIARLLRSLHPVGVELEEAESALQQAERILARPSGYQPEPR